MTESHEEAGNEAGEQPLPAVQTDTPVAQPADPAPRKSTPLTPLRSALTFAVIAALIVLQPLAAATYAKLFLDKSEQLIQPILPEAIPVPQALVWNPKIYGFVASLGALTSAAVLGLYIAFSCMFLYALLRILNPTFRMTTGVDWDRSLLLKTYMHSVPVTKAFLIAIAAFIPAFAAWEIIGWAMKESVLSLWIRLALSGAAFWYLFSSNGVAGDYDNGNYEPPREASARNSLLIRGALAGSIAWLTLQLLPALNVDGLFNMYHSIGYIGPGQWQAIVLITVGFAAAFGFAGGGLAAALGNPGWTPAKRAQVALLPGAVLILTALAGRVWMPAYLLSRYDYSVNDRRTAESRLTAHLTGVLQPPMPQIAYVIDSGHAIPVKFSGKSVTSLSASPEVAKQVEGYLREKQYQTALSYPAFTTLHDASLLQWSPAETLRIYLLNLLNAPNMDYSGHLLNKLQSNTFSATPEVISAIDKLADEHLFDYEDRRALVMVGDIYARFGARTKAEACYKRANMPPTQITLRADERVIDPKGVVTGRLLYEGRVVANAKVGLVAEQALMHLQNMPDADKISTSPFWLSWLGASTTTDAQGRFTMDRLIPGRYCLLFQLPPTISAKDAPLTVENGQSGFNLMPASPPYDTKDLNLRHN